MSKPINMRRCVVCRQVRHKSELIRVLLLRSNQTADSSETNNISIDFTGKQGGRGAYVCKSAECVTALKKRRNFDKIFKTKLPDELYDDVKASLELDPI